MVSSNNIIKNFYPHSVTGKTDDSFIGIKILGNDIHFYYPESYRFAVDTLDTREDIVDLLQTISIAKTNSLDLSKAFDDHQKDGEYALMSYLWIINDFLANGFYVNREKLFKVNQTGRVDWKRTLTSQPIISRGNIVYPNITVEVKNNEDNLLVEIHRFCVKKSIRFIGWLFNLDSSFIEDTPFNETIKKQYIVALQQELDRTFDDDKRVRLSHMKNVITGLDSSTDSRELVYGVDSYYYIFERMIDSIFGNVKNIKEFNPKATWQLVKNNYKETPSSDLRPDTIILDSESSTVYVLDAKFYRFGFTGSEKDLPETTSIQKQITYGEFIKKNVLKYNIKTIYSAFLLPYDKERDIFRSDDDIQYIGYAKSLWKDNTREHEIIHSFLIDLKHVVKSWNRTNHKKDISTLLQSIVQHSEEINKKHN